MNEKQIDDIKEALREMMKLLVQRGEPLSDELKFKIAQVMEHAATRITQLRQEQGKEQEVLPPEEIPAPEMQAPQANAATTLGPPPSPAAQLMWILAGQNVDAFINYLGTYPDPELRALLANPDELDRNINYLMQMMPPGQLPSQDGIEKAGINSSNIYGFKYNPKNGKLLVRFNSGAVYGYEGVPAQVFKVFQQGAVPAKTNGQNNYGRWWRGKAPSIGASFYELIKRGGYSYTRLS